MLYLWPYCKTTYSRGLNSRGLGMIKYCFLYICIYTLKIPTMTFFKQQFVYIRTWFHGWRMLSSNAYIFFSFVQVTTRYIEIPKCPRFTEMPDENTEMPLKYTKILIFKSLKMYFRIPNIQLCNSLHSKIWEILDSAHG